MKILPRYVTGSFLAAYLLSLLVLTFVLSVGLLIKATELVVKGLPARMVLRFLAAGMPESLTFTVPLALLVSALLVFGRLSADGEISAMKACGVRLLRVMAPSAVVGLLMALVCAYVNNEVSPRSHYARRDITALVHAGAGLKLLEPGRFITKFPGMTFWFARRDGDRLYDVLIFDKPHAGRNREIRADTAKVVVDGEDLRLELSQVSVDPFYDDRPGRATAASLTHLIPGAMKRRAYARDIDDYPFAELRARMAELRQAPSAPAAGVPGTEAQLADRERTRRYAAMRFELHRRMALAMSAFSFVLLGMPLGIRAQRRESTVGVALSLGITLLYYVLVIGADSLTRRPEWQPHLLAWLPAALCITLALWLIGRNQ